MLHPKEVSLSLAIILILMKSSTGLERVNSTPRRLQQNHEDVTTVLLVDNNGRSPYGRFLNVKPDVGLITATARTFVQEGVTTEYATQVVGTTLDDGRLYAHLLTKTSRVIYDGDGKPFEMNTKKITIDQNRIGSDHFIKNTDYIFPNKVEAHTVFAKTNSLSNQYNHIQGDVFSNDMSRESLKESSSNDIRIQSGQGSNHNLVFPEKISVFKINSHNKDERENLILHREDEDPLSYNPSKVKEWDNLPTFTVRNEFLPSGFSYLGDLPEFDSRTEKNKYKTPSDRRAKNLFLAGLLKPSPKELKTTTYTGFADFTTTVGDTVIIFTPHSTEVPKLSHKSSTKITVEPTIIPTATIVHPVFETQSVSPLVDTIFTAQATSETVDNNTSSTPKMEINTPVTKLTTNTYSTTSSQSKDAFEKNSSPTEAPDEESRNYVSSMVIDKNNRQKYGKSQNFEEYLDMEAKSSVLAHEQQSDSLSYITTLSPSAYVIEPSESQTQMLSTPSHEEIAKIFASLQAQANKATDPLNTAATIFFDSKEDLEDEKSGGATTIFFNDDLPILNTERDSSYLPTTEIVTVPESTTRPSSDLTTENHPEITSEIPITSADSQSTTTGEDNPTTEYEIETDVPSDEENLTLRNEQTIEEQTENCDNGIKIVPSSIYQTLTYLTTFFIPTGESTSTSIKSNEVVSTEVKQETALCSASKVSATIVNNTDSMASIITTEHEIETTESIIIENVETTELQMTPEAETEPPTTTEELQINLQEITTERRHVTESEPITTEETTEDGEEIELIFKTLYTTYTYLTTYFQETTSSVASRIDITTNVVTSTLDASSQSTEDAVSGLLESFTDVDTSYKSRPASFEDFEKISPSQLEPNIAPTTGDQKKDTIATPSLDNEVLGIKTYYTTYTYFTTIFVDDETEVSSRTEVYTNYVTPSIESTKTDSIPTPTYRFDDELEDENYEEKYDTSISRSNTSTTSPEAQNTEIQNIQQTVKNDYATLRRSTTENVPIEENILHVTNESVSTMVKSTTSNGERRLLNNVDKRNILDDQIVSESNNESEIIPSPTLLLQTSYTTFTYFTTMYHGTTGSNVVSRLETITNIVTETLTPSHTLSLDDLSLPITYFTTFTYWTTLYKQGTTKVTSREETISNVVTPTPTIENSQSTTIEFTPTVETTPVSSSRSLVEPTIVDNDLLTTVYTTYTYYTTSYVGDETVINSRLETVTSMLNKSKDIESNQITNTSESILTASDVRTETGDSSKPVLKPTGLLSTIINTEENSGTTTILSTDVFGTYIDGLYAKILESTSSILTESITPTTVVESLKSTGIVSINKGRIVDAEGISTLYYTTQAVGTYIDNLYAQVIESTSSLEVDKEKKALQTDIPVAKKTGLVRFIQGSIVLNSTTTIYQSKVIGTIIDGRYAQVIESTSSFLKDSIMASSTEAISPTSTLPPDEGIKATIATISPSSAVIEGSLSETLKSEDDTKEEDSFVNTKSKQNFQPKKKTFTPGIRPFVQRPKSSYTPKRRLPGGTSATTVTRNDFTPTVTAIPAARGKFGNRRNSAYISPTASNSKKFSGSKSSSFGGRRSLSRIQPSSTGFGSSSRRGGFRSSSSGAILRSSGLPSNSAKFRIRPTTTSPQFKSSVYLGNAEPIENGGENSETTQINDESENSENETTLQEITTTESNKRQNPLLKLLRTPLSRPPINSGRAQGSKTTRTNPKNRNSKRTTTTTAKPKTTRPSSSFRGRPNALFPRRNLFTTSTTTTEPPEEEEEEVEETLIEENEEEEDNDYEGSQKQSVIAKPPINSGVAGVKIKPFKFGKRTRRDTYSRFKRPTAKSTTSAPEDDYVDYEVPKPKPKNNRFAPRSRKPKTTSSTTLAPASPSRKVISPNKVKPQSRTQFTLRPEKEMSNFRRPISQRSNSRIQNQRTTTPSPRARQRSSYNNYQLEPQVNRKTSSKSNSRNSNRRTQSRQRAHSQDLNENNVLPSFDGTITVTHQIPTELTIPVVNGIITEYKNIVTAKLSTEVLGPAQYSTTLNPIGREVTILLSESTNVANNGATLITQFVLNETPTTSVTFTPTYIRNRKTSYSHVVPSTIYSVEQVVNTIQPALAAQAPLANILLSQLLLGGLQPQNPLLALQNPGLTPTPTTEFQTRTTTYVTTVTSSTSTVIPLTFRGKEILTTILDSSVNVITATEFLTDTIVVTPTVRFPVAAAPQLNTLLLPLLQQQLAQQPVPQFIPKNDHFNSELFQGTSPSESDEFNLAVDGDEDEEEAPVVESKPKIKKGINKPKKIVTVEPVKETSVITLYVSGKTPGEFSTILSTIIQDPRDRQKRESREEIRPSKIMQDLLVSTQEYQDTYILPGKKELLNISPEANSETESLESILGDVSKYSINTSRSKIVINPTQINDFTEEYRVEKIQSSERKMLSNFLA